MLVDSHCHLDRIDLAPYDGAVANALAAAKDNDVDYMLCVSIDLEKYPAVRELAETYANVFASVGVHPNETDCHDPSVDELVELASHPRVVAVGETGLDYYRSQGDISWQQERFRRHIRAAKLVNKPLIIHTRNAREDTVRILQEEGAHQVGGVFHCFTESWEMAQQGMALNFVISFSGIVTFKNARELQQVAKQVPLDSILVETDAPFLAPVPYRGKPNVPAYVRHVAEFIAELRELDYASVAKQTTENFFRVFPQARILVE